MKNLINVLIVICSLSVLSCNKNTSKGLASGGSTTGVLSLSQAQVSKGEPLVASLPAGVTASAIKWWVNTNTPTHITQSNGQALIMFSSTGTYQVTAAYSTTDSAYSDTATASVAVNDSTYSPPPPVNTDTSSLSGDLITLTPSFDSLGNLLFTAQTTNSYGCEPYLVSLIYGSPAPGGPIQINFYEVISDNTGTCNGVANPATAFEFTTTANWSDGVYPLTVNMGTNSYTGTVTISGSSYSFAWNYSFGVVISPLQVHK